MAKLGFNLKEVKESSGEKAPLPLGQFIVRIESTEQKIAKDKVDENGYPKQGNGHNAYLRIDSKVYGNPEFKDYIDSEFHNIIHVNEQTQNIARSKVKQISLAALGYEVSDDEELLGQWLIIENFKTNNGKVGRKYLPLPKSMIPAHVPAFIKPLKPQEQQQASLPVSEQKPSWAS